MASYIYLYDGTNTLELDNECTQISIGGNKRRFNFIDYLGQDGSQLRGTGSLSNKEITVTHIEKTEGADTNAWNSRKTDFESWANRPIWDDVYLYVINGEGSLTLRTPVVCTEIPAFSGKFRKISDPRQFKFRSKTGIFKSTTATNDTLAITGSTEQSDTIVVTGTAPAWCTFSYTPTGASETSFRVRWQHYSFTLTNANYYDASVQISYDMSNGQLTFGGARVIAGQYLSSGSPFALPVGNNTVYVKCSGAGTFAWTYNARYV